jgi:uroporphyrin-III C-methyltransferase/precorrin-2 dehydrogenase/sirohydrochlorin ferrochelatase
MADPEIYPLFLRLGGRGVLVVGAGAVAGRKIEALVEAGARVRVVAPSATARVRELADAGTVEWHANRFVEGDAEGAWLAIAATSDADVQRAVSAACAARRIFCIAVDDPPNATAYSGAVVRRPPFTIAISSSGETPALTRLVREVIEAALPSEQWVQHARALRKKWRAEKTPMGQRFAELVRDLAKRRG